MKRFFNYFIYISVAFLLIALIKADYLIIPKIHSYLYLVLSFITLFIGFLAESLSWKKTLAHFKYECSYKNGIISIGLSIFGKYIPGKIWTIIGRSSYIAKQYNYKESQIAYISVIAQLISLWIGFILGLLGLFLIKDFSGTGWLALTAWLILTIFLFFKPFHNLITRIFRFILKREIKIPVLDFKIILKLLPYFLLRWILFALSFYFLINCLSNDLTKIYFGLGFPLAGTIGLITFFIPGGLGVREGIITGFLIAAGIDPPVATTISVSSRLWFLTGEFFIFILSFILKRFKQYN